MASLTIMKAVKAMALAAVAALVTAACGASETTMKGPGGQDPASAYASALTALAKAPTVTYSVQAPILMTRKPVRSDREVSIDARKRLASTRLRIYLAPDRSNGDLTALTVASADAAFVTMPGSNSWPTGKWMKLTEVQASPMGVPLNLDAFSTVPKGLAGFTAAEWLDATTMKGTFDAQSTLELLGMSKLVTDTETAASLTGSAPAVVTIDPTSGALARVDIIAKDNSIEATSGSLPDDGLKPMLTSSDSTITITQIGQPVSISMPAAKDIYTR